MSEPNQYKRINSNATTTVTGNAAQLHTIVVGAAGSAWVIDVYDGTSSDTQIAQIKPTAPVTLIYDVYARKGLTIVTTGTTAGDLTVSWG